MKKRKLGVRGSITVFVALMMVPTVAFTGLMADFARMNMASVQVQNAAYLAASSALAHYEGLLFDVYGLLATSQQNTGNDPIQDFAETIVWRSLGMDEGGDRLYMPSLNLFGPGSVEVNIELGGTDYSLENLAQLRYQILRYMAFRGITMTELTRAIAQVSEQKGLNPEFADDEVEFMQGKYNDILRKFGELQKKYRGIENAFNEIEDIDFDQELSDIADWQDILQSVREELNAELAHPDPDWERVFQLEEDEAFAINEIRQIANELLGSIEIYKEILEIAENLSREADALALTLKDMINNARDQLNDGSGTRYSPVKVDAIIENLDALQELILDHELAGHGTTFNNTNRQRLENLRDALQSVLATPSFEITVVLNISPYATNHAARNDLIDINNSDEAMSMEEFEKIIDGMDDWMGDTNSDNIPDVIDFEEQGPDGEEGNLARLNRDNSTVTVADRHNLDDLNIPPSIQSGIELPTDLTRPGRFMRRALSRARLVAGRTRTSTGLASYRDIGIFGVADFAVNRLLVVEYGVQMFSNYTTNRRMVNGEIFKDERTLSGIPLGKRMNYMYGAELEFLFVGIQNTPVVNRFLAFFGREKVSVAQANVDAAIGALSVQLAAQNFLFVLRCQDIQNTKRAIIKIGGGKIGAVVAAIYLAAIITAETYLDVQTLLAGQRVPTIKNPNSTPSQWRTGLNHHWRTGDQNAWGTSPGSALFVHCPTTANNEGPGMYYYEHLRRLILLSTLLPRGLDILTNRIGVLIELNMNHHLALKEGGARVSSNDRFNLSKAYVLARAEVEVEFRHLFIGGPVINGEVGSRFTATAVRGY